MAVQPLMDAEVSQQLGAEKSERAESRSGHQCGYRPRRLDTRMGTMCRRCGIATISRSLLRSRKRSEVALIQVVQKAFVQGASTRKTEKLAKTWELKVCPAARSAR